MNVYKTRFELMRDRVDANIGSQWYETRYLVLGDTFTIWVNGSRVEIPSKLILKSEEEAYQTILDKLAQKEPWSPSVRYTGIITCAEKHERKLTNEKTI